MPDIGSARSLLFVPGTRPDRIEKAMATDADRVIIDMEDSVPIGSKAEVRPVVSQKIDEFQGRGVMVRINALTTGFFDGDLGEVVRPGLVGIILPKVQLPEDVVALDNRLIQYEISAKMPPGRIPVVSLIETALGVENAFRIAAAALDSSRNHILAFGAADFCLDMGIRLSKTGEELTFPRSKIAVGSRAAGLNPPIDTPFMLDFNDDQAFTADLLRGKSLGFGGKLCIHPKQVDLCNRLYSPTKEEIIHAEKVVSAFKKAEGEGQAAIQVEGKLVDYPIYIHSQRILQIAERLQDATNGPK